MAHKTFLAVYCRGCGGDAGFSSGAGIIYHNAICKSFGNPSKLQDRNDYVRFLYATTSLSQNDLAAIFEKSRQYINGILYGE